MKQKDIALILVIGFISAMISFVLSGLVFNSAEDKKLESQVVVPITADFPTPSDKYFNESSVDPTQIISIGGDGNKQPLSQ